MLNDRKQPVLWWGKWGQGHPNIRSVLSYQRGTLSFDWRTFWEVPPHWLKALNSVASASLFFFLCLCVSSYKASPSAYGDSQARGRIGAIAAGVYHSHSNARSPTHWATPRIEPAFSWMLVKFVSTEPRQELLSLPLWKQQKHYS